MSDKEHKKIFKIAESRQLVGLGVGIALSTFTLGCSYHGAKLVRADAKLAEESKALTTAVVEVLTAQPSSQHSVYTATALDFARQDQRLEGFPNKPFDVPALLAGFGLTNQTHLGAPPTQRAIAEARQETQTRFEAQNKLLAARAATESKLQQLGAAAETNRNAKITRWTKITGWTLSLAGGAAALFIACPLALPIAGRLLAWVVGKLPGLASALGVVSVRAFDSVVRAIEKTRATTAAPTATPTAAIANDRDSRRDSANFLATLETQLSREMDAAHKALVRARKQTLNP